jgi:SAM-dependent methyltransferase
MSYSPRPSSFQSITSRIARRSSCRYSFANSSITGASLPRAVAALNRLALGRRHGRLFCLVWPTGLPSGGYPRPVFSPQGPSLRELCIQALSSVERGYDLLAPKFDHTPFRTPERVLAATVHALSEHGPFRDGLDLCCGTGAGNRVLRSLCQGRATGVDFSAGMLAQARSAHPDATWVRADARALPFAEGFDLAVTFGALGHFLPTERPALFEGGVPRVATRRAVRLPDRRTAAAYLGLTLGRARIRPGHADPQCRVAAPVRHVLPHPPAARSDRRPDGGRLHRHGRRPDRPGRQPSVPARPRTQIGRPSVVSFASRSRSSMTGQDLRPGLCRGAAQVGPPDDRGVFTRELGQCRLTVNGC